MNVFDTRLQIEGAQLDFFLELGKSDHELLLGRDPVQALDILQLNRRIGSESHHDDRPRLDSHDVGRPLGIAGVAKSRDWDQALLLQPAKENTPDRFFNHKITQVSLGNLAESVQNPFLDFFFHGFSLVLFGAFVPFRWLKASRGRFNRVENRDFSA